MSGGSYILTFVLTEEAPSSKAYENAVSDFVSHAGDMIVEISEGPIEPDFIDNDQRRSQL
tara:strand:+ start:5000 stop:5179 length:180 start_codon:yes stop_codon:yes gene_type:complete